MDLVEANLDRLAGVVTTLADNVVRMSETIIRLEEGQHRLEESQRRNDEAIGVLVRMMDEWIRNNPRQDFPGECNSRHATVKTWRMGWSLG